MSLVSFNPFAILVATVVTFALGALWYGVLFNQAWLRLNGYGSKSETELDEMKADASKAYVVSFVCNGLTAAALTVLADYIILDTIPQALKLALLVFGGFVGPVGLIANFYSDRPIGAWLLDGAYQLIYLILMSIIVVLWL
ncbi:MAG: DUF1761 domain-containing protein [Candidatus Latescibacteria bacterium]|jgi:hypothetical protein|nr:hypothetical protein [Gemmatimonadaceae bacterium]MDP6018006.1 DUF1761 domain-containing protein [Candidatus Latescibacterota bacterium]MDP7447269.1 DUF1761 domain-containing protein [Candidatus Latescibacterota bacterium]HJP30105.1 DUF1761 domain-containing protein [Candidatus Latescibacterota bacterium]